MSNKYYNGTRAASTCRAGRPWCPPASPARACRPRGSRVTRPTRQTASKSRERRPTHVGRWSSIVLTMRPKSWDMRTMRTDLEESLPRSLSVGQTRSGHKDGVLGDFLVFSVNSAALEQLGISTARAVDAITTGAVSERRRWCQKSSEAAPVAARSPAASRTAGAVHKSLREHEVLKAPRKFRRTNCLQTGVCPGSQRIHPVEWRLFLTLIRAY